jgi:general nucleoside transport system ATP-binding protein
MADAGTDIAVRMTGIVKRFPGIVANDGVEFEARVGEVHALLGENGAGKSTLSNILTGLYRPDEGHIHLQGVETHFASPRAALDAGIGMVHQHFRLVSSFSVAENIVLGDDTTSFMVDAKSIEARVEELSGRYGLAVDPRAKVWQLSVGEQQRVEILKVLYRGAKVLILDEPTAVLTPQEADVLFSTLRAMVAEGRTVIFISHKLDEVMAVSDRVTVLRGGKTVGTVNTKDSSTRDLARLMVGREVVFHRVQRAVTADASSVVLSLDSVSALDDRGNTALNDVSLTVGRGEIVGVAGVSGNGQRELAEVIAGMRASSAGAISVNGETVQTGRVRKSIGAGIAHVPEDRLHTGLAPSHSVQDNLVLKSYRSSPISKLTVLVQKMIRSNAEQLVEKYDVKTPSTETPVRLLSGGNVQKVLLAREFSTDPRVLVAASPTRGLDVGAIESVRTRLVEAADRGVGVLLISEDLEEILSLADRVLVMYEGRIVGNVPAQSANREMLGLLMGGATLQGSDR